MVLLLVEPVTPEVLLSVPVVPLPEAPIELVPPVVPAVLSVLLPVVPPVAPAVLPVVVSVEPDVPDVPDVPAVLDGLVVLLDEVAELPAPAPASSFLPQALSNRAPTIASTAAALWVRDIFIRVTP